MKLFYSEKIFVIFQSIRYLLLDKVSFPQFSVLGTAHKKNIKTITSKYKLCKFFL